MAISKKGFRKITVNGQVFFWKFNERILVIDKKDSTKFLSLDFGWYDVWLYVNDKDNQPPDFEPKTVTPKFVCESIEFAIKNDWKEGRMQIEYRNGNYIFNH